jgi:hypothetical protein
LECPGRAIDSADLLAGDFPNIEGLDNPVEDFQWIALMSNAPFVIALHPSVPARDLPGLIAYCKDNPGKLSYGHAGLGTTVHLAGELLKERAGINLLDVPYAGSAPAINDTLAGTVQMIIETSATLLPHHKSGRLRIISTMAEAREKIAPEIPTAREAGLDLIAGTCNLLAAPLGTPPQERALQLAAALQGMDLDGNGRVDLAEFTELIRRLQLLREGEERLLLYLMPVDGDGNDRLDADELRRLLRSIGQVPLTATEESQLFGPTGSALTWRNFVDRLLLT